MGKKVKIHLHIFIKRKDLIILERLPQAFLVALLYYLTGELSFVLLSGENIINLGVFLPEGIALAFALFYGRSVLIGIFFGQFILAFMNGISLEASIGVGLVNTLEAYIAIITARYFTLDIRLKSFKDISILMGMIIFILQPFSAIGGNLVLLYYGANFDNLFSSLFSWWFGNIMGQMLVTPFVLLLLQEYKKISIQEFLVYGLLFFAFEYILELVLVIKNPFLLLSLTLPLVVFVIFKKGLVYGLFLNVIAALISSYAVYLGVGAFHSGSTVDNIINYNLFILAHITISLTAGILLEEKKHYEEHLEDMVAQELEKNRQQQLFMLQQSRLAQMGEMISMIAHQWRQPLNNLSLINQFLLNKYKKNSLDDDAIAYFKKNSHRQIALMSQTIDDFRNFFQSDKSKEYFCVDSVVERLLDMTDAIFRQYHIEIIYTCSYKAEVYGHSNEFAQALLNIINNAKDALLERRVHEKKIYINLYEQEDIVILEIEDNAGGIDECIQEKIFDPYFSTKKEKNGTGLGLYMSKMILEEKMGASLGICNSDKGACFIITMRKGK